MLFRFVLRIGSGAFDQQVVVWDDYCLRLSRADFLPLVLQQVTAGCELQFGRLGRLGDALLPS